MKKFFSRDKKILRQKGAMAILLSVLVLGVMLVIGLTISAIMISQISMSAQAGQSVKAFYAADSAAELCLYQARNLGGVCDSVGGSFSGDLSNGANYAAQRIDGTTISATGFFGKTSRRVELTWEGVELIPQEEEPPPSGGELPPPPVSSETKLLLHADETGQYFYDSSVYNHTINAVGDATQSSTRYITGGKSAYFDGDGDYLSIPDSDDWNFGSGDFTVDFWVRFSSIAATNIGLFGQDIWNNGGMGFWHNPDNGLRFYCGPASVDVSYLSGVLSINTWYHVAVVRSGGTITLYLNGTAKASDSSIGEFPDKTAAFEIASIVDGQRRFNGYIDEFRLTKGSALWTSNFTPPYADFYTKLLLHADGNGQSFIDSSFSGRSVTAYGDVNQNPSQSMFGGKSAKGDGVGDYLTSPYSADFDMGTGDFTIDWWFYANDVSAARGVFRAGGYPSGYEMYYDSSNRFQFMGIGGSWVNGFASTNTVSRGVWHHLALVRSGTSFKFFVDGILDKDTFISPDATFNTAGGTFSVGAMSLRDGIDNGATMNGFYDEFRVSKGVARWTSNFVPPTAPYNP